MFKAFKLVKDEWIPGTLNIGHTIPTIAQGFIFIGSVESADYRLTRKGIAPIHAVIEFSRTGGPVSIFDLASETGVEELAVARPLASVLRPARRAQDTSTDMPSASSQAPL